MFLVADPTIIPTTLSERSDQIGALPFLLLVCCFLLLALVRYSRYDFYSRLFIAWLKIKGLHSFLKESFANLRGGTSLLIVNYLLSTSMVLYFQFEVSFQGMSYFNVLLLSLPALYLIWSYLSVWLVSFISGENYFVRDLIQVKILGIEVSGIAFYLIALSWVLYPHLATDLWILFLAILFIDNLWRIIKGLWLTNSAGASWYYIILYLCSLEILPLFVAYYVLAQQDFN